MFLDLMFLQIAQCSGEQVLPMLFPITQTVHLVTLFSTSFLNISSCFLCTATFACRISGLSINVLSSRCSELPYTTV